MTATILDGRAMAREIQAEIQQRTESFTAETGVTPTLAAVLVGEDPASQVYVRNKQRACQRVGITSQLYSLDAHATTDDLRGKVEELNENPDVHGILVQLPLPDQVDSQQILDLVHPLKDVDAFHPLNVGLLAQGRPRYLPCTPHGILQLLHRYDISAEGKQVVVLGRSDIVGKPISMLLSAKRNPVGASVSNATVTLCHSRTANLPEVVARGEIVIAAIGRPKFVTAGMVRPGAVVIDVGINRTEEGLVGDVDFGAVSQVASHITPVPGGIGPLTVTMLLENTLQAATRITAGDFNTV